MGEKDSPGDSTTESGLSSSTNSSKYSSTSEGSKDYSVSSAGAKGWPLPKPPAAAAKDKPQFSKEDERIKLRKLGSRVSDVEMMRERFAKLLLGEDMSGGGRGVCPALAISNAVTNLCATVFGQLWTLAPLPNEKKLMWRKELDCLLSVGDHIVELVPSVQSLADGTKLEIMASRPRSDILMNLPALRKLDLLLLEILDSFAHKTEFWYVDQDLEAPDADGSASFRQTIQRQEEKWWLPVPRLHACGLLEDTRKKLVHKRECAAQILKAAMAINNSALAEMDVPDSYIETLPKNGRSCLGEVIYRYITSDHFSSDCLLDCLDLSSEHVALDIANRIEASIYVWRSRIRPRNHLHPTRSTAKSSWEMVKDFVIDGDRARALLAERAENLLLSLKQRFPGLSQTTLDVSKIQCNKDVGKSILESYSRVLESLAFNIVARIDDLLYVDDLTKQSDNLSASSTPRVSIMAQRKVGNPYPVSLSGTPCGTTFTTPNFSPAPHGSSPREDMTPLINGSKLSRRGIGVKRVLTNYLNTEVKVKNCGVLLEGLGSASQKASDMNVSENKQVSAWK